MRLLIAGACALFATAAFAQTGNQDARPADMQTDSATAGQAATMDGTMPTDASPAAGGGNAAAADQANTGETGNPIPGASTTTTDGTAAGGGMSGTTTQN